MTESIIAPVGKLRAARGEEYADGFVDALNVLVSASSAEASGEG